ncbi:MAG: DUF5655 domain-containing protein [Candidatus Woesearchaeota archaeon]
MRKEEAVIVTKDGRYHLYNYESEIELEKMIIEHSSEIFGKNTRYFNKRKIESKSGLGTTPDGYVIDFDKKKLYIVEVELIKHDLRRHILPQITSFIMALQNEKSREKLVEIFEEELKSSYKLSKEELKSIVTNYGIIILIDEVGDPMKEVNPLLEIVNFLATHGEVIALPFQTYVKDNKLSPDHIHLFKSFTKEELEKESRKWTFKWTTVPVEERLEKLDDNLKEVLRELGKKVCCIADNIKEKHPKSGYTTYQISKLKNFCAIKFPKGKLEIYLKVDNNTFTDKKKITEDIKRTPSWTFDKVFTIRSQKDIDYAISLIEQAYQCICKSKNKSR